MTESAANDPGAGAGDLPEALPPLLELLRSTAKDRDAAGGTAKAERNRLRESGLLGLLVPREWGGGGASWPVIFQSVRQVAAVDGSLGHLFGFQHLLLATVRLFGAAEQWKPLWRETAAHGWFWGNALNPRDDRVTIRPDGTRWRVDGSKSFCSGAVDADRLIISALNEEGKLVVAAVPSDRRGIRVRGDWDAFGQRQTDSGGVDFEGVVVEESEILRLPGPLGTPFAALRSLIAQLVFVNVYLGLAEGAFAHCRHWVGKRAEDPFVLRRAGELWAGVEGTRALSERAADALQTAWNVGEPLRAEQRGEVAVAVAAAKIWATRTSLEVTSGIFELTGPRAVATTERLDRYWRNARVHTLHDPLDHKFRDLGAFALGGIHPPPSFYS